MKKTEKSGMGTFSLMHIDMDVSDIFVLFQILYSAKEDFARLAKEDPDLYNDLYEMNGPFFIKMEAYIDQLPPIFQDVRQRVLNMLSEVKRDCPNCC